jgi:transcriptional regulator with XRE-family HTH domain
MSTDAKFVKALAKNIDRIRQEKGFSFQEMALACDMEKAQVYRICKEGINVTAVTLMKIAKGHEVPISELFNFKY